MLSCGLPPLNSLAVDSVSVILPVSVTDALESSLEEGKFIWHMVAEVSFSDCAEVELPDLTCGVAMLLASWWVRNRGSIRQGLESW